MASSTPADGSTIAESPAEIQITFTEAVGEANTITVTCNTELFTVGPRRVSEDNLTLNAEVIDPLPKGTCVAAWAVSDPTARRTVRATSPSPWRTVPASSRPPPRRPARPRRGPPTHDGCHGHDWHHVHADTAAPTRSRNSKVSTPGRDRSGSAACCRCSVSPSCSARSSSSPPHGQKASSISSPSGSSVRRGSSPSSAPCSTSPQRPPPSPAVGWGADSIRRIGSDLFDAGIPGIAAIARLVLVAASGFVAFRPDRVIDPVTQMVSLGIPALAVATIGLSRTNMDLPILGIPLAIIHAVAMSVWLGGVVLLARVVLAGPGEEDLVHAVRGFSRLSNVAIGVTVATGVVQMVLLDGGDLFGSPHGRVVLLKTVVVAVTIFVAVSARQFVNHRLARADELSIPMADRLRRAFGVEALAGVVILALSAWLLSFTPPNVDTSAAISYAIERQFDAPEADLDVTVKLTTDRVGLAGMEVTVNAPESGLSGLEVVLTAPTNDELGGYTQPVPLTGPGVAVLHAANGMPLTVPGEWTMSVNAVTPVGAYNSPPRGSRSSTRTAPRWSAS